MPPGPILWALLLLTGTTGRPADPPVESRVSLILPCDAQPCGQWPAEKHADGGAEGSPTHSSRMGIPLAGTFPSPSSLSAAALCTASLFPPSSWVLWFPSFSCPFPCPSCLFSSSCALPFLSLLGGSLTQMFELQFQSQLCHTQTLGLLTRLTLLPILPGCLVTP